MLPDGEGLALVDADFERVGIDLADRRHLRPRAGSAMRSRAAPTSKPISEVLPSSSSCSRMSISEVSALPDTCTWSMAKPVPRRDRLRHVRDLAAEHRRRRGRSRRAERPLSDGVAEWRGERESPAARRRGQPHRPAQPARQHETVSRHDRNGAPTRAALTAPVPTSTQTRRVLHHPTQKFTECMCPHAAAISGTSDVGVMPGWVLTSSQMISPSSEWRSS